MHTLHVFDDRLGWRVAIDRFVSRRFAWLAILVPLGTVACGSDQAPTTNPGQTGTGGSAANGSGGGSAAGGSGGVTGSGGASGSAGVGGVEGSGGAGGTGGAAAGGAGGSTGGGTGGSIGDAGDGGSGDACTRESLKAAVDQYFQALTARDSSSLPLASNVKFTENGGELALGEGLWRTAGALKFKHSAFDVETCSSVTESVVADGSTDIPFGLRLKLEAGRITEIETIAVRRGDYFVSSNTQAIIATESENWEASVPPDQRATRADLAKIVDDYFERFPAGACNFAPDCRRLENGFSPGTCSLGLSCSTSGSGSMGMTPRLHVHDVEAGIAVGFVMFLGGYIDFHMFKVRASEVHGVHAILASADASGWE